MNLRREHESEARYGLLDFADFFYTLVHCESLQASSDLDPGTLQCVMGQVPKFSILKSL